MVRISPECETFRQTYFPDATLDKWSNWKWQLQNRIHTPSALQQIFDLNNSESKALSQLGSTLPVSITPYYASIALSKERPSNLRKTIIPSVEEFDIQPEEMRDPLLEEKQSPTKCIIHRYPDRLVFLTSPLCPVYCRYCTRSRLVGMTVNKMTRDDWDAGLDYIKSRSEVREVIVSGGDPLLLNNSRLEYLLSELRKIPHIQIIRISTKMPVVLPQRITSPLVTILKKSAPIYINIHVVHPAELSPESDRAVNKLIEGGVILGSQTVLLRGVNDELPVMKELMERLLTKRIRPYALYQCDLTQGLGHFRTSIQTGLDLMAGLRRYTSGFAIPQYIADPPGGKVSLNPNSIVSTNATGYVLKNWEGKNVSYPDVRTV